MVAETSHKDGERGVLLAKRLLESTTHVVLPFSVYDDANQTTLVRLDGAVKRYDLAGHFLGEKRRPLSVEVKNYTTVGHQPADYTEFLANAYSITANERKNGIDTKREFMWMTTHPFSQTKWMQLTSGDEIRSALVQHEDALNKDSIDEEILVQMADRLWLVVMHDRQDELSLSRAELYKVHAALDRKGY
jgi:hypothetical protein